MTEQSDATRELEAAKERARDEIEDRTEQLVGLSHTIHANPELSWEEHKAAALVAKTMRDAGFEVAEKAYGVETAVEAVYGNGDLTVVVCAEYDALPGVGQRLRPQHDLRRRRRSGTGPGQGRR